MALATFVSWGPRAVAVPDSGLLPLHTGVPELLDLVVQLSHGRLHRSGVRLWRHTVESTAAGGAGALPAVAATAVAVARHADLLVHPMTLADLLPVSGVDRRHGRSNDAAAGAAAAAAASSMASGGNASSHLGYEPSLSHICLLVERRHDNGLWPRGVFGDTISAEADTAEWRAGLRVGSEVDARDSMGVWFDGIVIAMEEAAQARPAGPAAVGSAGKSLADALCRVHFRGWVDSKWDVLLERTSPNLAPLRTHTRAWTQALVPGSLLEVAVRHAPGVLAPEAALRWNVGMVVATDHAYLPPQLHVAHPVHDSEVATVVIVTRDSDSIAAKGTHFSGTGARRWPTALPPALARLTATMVWPLEAVETAAASALLHDADEADSEPWQPGARHAAPTVPGPGLSLSQRLRARARGGGLADDVDVRRRLADGEDDTEDMGCDA
jgi:hypothetical protein